jgi:hypothetical protein
MNETLQRACRLGNLETVKEILEFKPFLKDAVKLYFIHRQADKLIFFPRFWTTFPGHRCTRLWRTTKRQSWSIYVH